jgi:hypothetical protein
MSDERASGVELFDLLAESRSAIIVWVIWMIPGLLFWLMFLLPTFLSEPEWPEYARDFTWSVFREVVVLGGLFFGNVVLAVRLTLHDRGVWGILWRSGLIVAALILIRIWLGRAPLGFLLVLLLPWFVLLPLAALKTGKGAISADDPTD